MNALFFRLVYSSFFTYIFICYNSCFHTIIHNFSKDINKRAQLGKFTLSVDQHWISPGMYLEISISWIAYCTQKLLSGKSSRYQSLCQSAKPKPKARRAPRLLVKAKVKAKAKAGVSCLSFGFFHIQFNQFCLSLSSELGKCKVRAASSGRQAIMEGRTQIYGSSGASYLQHGVAELLPPGCGNQNKYVFLFMHAFFQFLYVWSNY